MTLPPILKMKCETCGYPLFKARCPSCERAEEEHEQA